MEFLILALVALSVAGFGFFVAYENVGPWWTVGALLVFLFLAAGISAIGEAEATSVAWQFGFNVIVFLGFLTGYSFGQTNKRTWWSKKVLTCAIVTSIMIVYLLLL